MTDPAALEAKKRELLASREAIEAEVERIDAQLAEPGPPVEEALREALKGDLRLTYHERVVWSNGFRDGYAAALPLTPLSRAAMGEREIEELARKCADSATGLTFDSHARAYQASKLAIRETLRRVPGWPGEDVVTIEEVVDLLGDAGTTSVRLEYTKYWHDKRRDILARLQKRMGAGGEA